MAGGSHAILARAACARFVADAANVAL